MKTIFGAFRALDTEVWRDLRYLMQIALKESVPHNGQR